jgi:all-trans-retinol 13,14-reductase
MKFDTIVIGSGISGLTAALLLSRYNREVAIIEKSPQISPLISRFKRNGIWCDPGFHYSGGLNSGGQLNIIFRFLGLENDIKPVPLNPDCFDTIIIDSKAYSIPYGIDRVKDYLCKRFSKNSKAVNNYLKILKRIVSTNPLMNIKDFNVEENNLNETSWEQINLKEQMIKIGAGEDFIKLAGIHSDFLCGSGENDIPLDLFAYIIYPFYQFTGSLKEGGDSLVRAFTAKLKEKGVPIFLDSKVTRILSNSHKQITGIQLENGEIIQCNACISTIHPMILLNLLPKEQIRPVYIHRIKQLENTFSPFVVFFDTTEIPSPLANSNYFIINEKEKKGKYAFLSPVCKKDFNNKKSLTAVKHCDLSLFKDFIEKNDKINKSKYSELKERLTSEITEYLLEHFPELKGKIRILETATPVTYYRHTGTYLGSAYGVKQSTRYGRIDYNGRMKGLFLAGQSLIPGIMGAIMSSLIAVFPMIPSKTLLKELKSCI